MSGASPRIAILGIHLESNAFAPVTTEEDFRASCHFEGPAMLAEAAQPAPAMPGEIPGFIGAMNATGPWEPVPILITATEPGGTANRLVAQPGASGAQAELVLPAPLDLRPFDELRLWIRASEPRSNRPLTRETSPPTSP